MMTHSHHHQIRRGRLVTSQVVDSVVLKRLHMFNFDDQVLFLLSVKSSFPINVKHGVNLCYI